MYTNNIRTRRLIFKTEDNAILAKKNNLNIFLATI
jgi:hypothetical protein